MKLSKKAVEHIAMLSRIKLSEREKEEYRKKLTQILDYVEQLNQVDTEEIKPTHQITSIVNPTREDKAVSSGKEKKLIDAAPQKEGNFVKVRAVFE